jgi:Asp-tRNA(Asn)/Glu-tRNA(Gln) amidotransferase A subunit family amidase
MRRLVLACAVSSLALLPRTDIDADLTDVTVPRLEALYASHAYTVTDVTRWHLDRVARYDGVYKAFLHVDRDGALAAAAVEDAGGSPRGALWGVPVVIKANTSVHDLVTSTGWTGYLVAGHELVAPRDATIVAKLREAGAVILGQTNMPDFAASDTTNSSAGGRTGNAYDWRFSPGGSSGGTVTAVASSFAVLGNGTDTGNSIRMPAGTSALVGVLPTRGLVSIAGIHPLDWLRDNTGPIARTVTDAAIALDVMAGADPRDARTAESSRAEPRPYTKYLTAGALKGRRFGVPAFVLHDPPPPGTKARALPLTEETRAMLMTAVGELRAAGATVVIEPTLLPDDFLALTNAIDTRPYRREGTEDFLGDYGPPEYRSVDAFEAAVRRLPPFISGTGTQSGQQRRLETDPDAGRTFWTPRKKALEAYAAALDRRHLDGLVYPSAQMPPNDETLPGPPSSGPHSETGWVNPLGVPAIVVPAGFYPDGLPFGLEFSARLWKDGDLLAWAFAYEQATRHRRPPVLVDRIRQ